MLNPTNEEPEVLTLQDQIDRLARQHGRVCVGHRCALSGLTSVFTPDWAEHLVNDAGIIQRSRPNASIDWSE